MDVAVIGDEIDKNFFPAHDGLGKTILVDGVAYQVIGVLEKRKGQLFKDETADRVVKVPYNAYHKHYPAADEHFLGAEAYPGFKDAAEDEVRGLLRRRRNVPFDKPDNFGLSSAEAIADNFRQIMSTVALMTIVVSSIGLLVGGVGVMNIMLMSVTERTHEIGIRKAIGARRGDVIRQFLTEAVVLTGLGGLVGSLAGSGCVCLPAADLPFDAHLGPHLGRSCRGADGDERRPVLRNLSRGESLAARSRRGLALRVAVHLSASDSGVHGVTLAMLM